MKSTTINFIFISLALILPQITFANPELASTHFEIDLQNESTSNNRPEMISLSIVATSILTTRISPKDRKSSKAMNEYLKIRQEITSQSKTISEKFKSYYYSVLLKRNDRSFISFAVQLLNTEDVILRAMAIGFLSNIYNANLSNDKSRIVLSKLLISAQSSRSLVIKKTGLSPEDFNSLKSLPELQNLESITYNDYLIIGNGLSFFAMNEIIKNIEKEQNPNNKTKLLKSLSKVSQASLLHVYSFVMGSVGQFDPISKNLIFSMLSRVNEKSWAHEVEHYRFDQMTQELIKWMKSKNYAMPYEVDGPAIEGGGEFGGLYTLLNELNSWRLEMSLNHTAAKSQWEIDQEILRTFQSLYISQVGPETIELMNQLWNSEFLSVRSVPRLIRKKILELNTIETMQIPESIVLATDQSNDPRIINLLRLVQT